MALYSSKPAQPSGLGAEVFMLGEAMGYGLGLVGLFHLAQVCPGSSDGHKAAPLALFVPGKAVNGQGSAQQGDRLLSLTGI